MRSEINDILHESATWAEAYNASAFLFQGVARYACYRSTNQLKMMGDVAGSDKRFSFRNSVSGSKLHVFESPIDMLSYTHVKSRVDEFVSGAPQFNDITMLGIKWLGKTQDR